MNKSPNLIARLREWIRPTRSDTIISTIGEGAHDIDIVVGKNIRVVKIGTLVVPAVPVFIGVVILLALIAIGAYLYFVPAQMPTDTFNIAVAQFGVMNADKQIVITADSQSFSARIYNALGIDLADLSKAQANLPKTVVWNDILFPTQMRSPIGLIPGATAEERRQAASKRATDLNAAILIYGNVDATTLPPNFIPEFHVAPLKNEADEIVGQYQFGAPIPVQQSSLPGETWAQTLADDKTLRARRQALALVTFGLLKDFRGEHEDALSHFQNALAILRTTKNQAGEEVLDYFIGREYLFMANLADANADSLNAPAAAAQVELNLAQAEAAFNAAKKWNAAYARADYGLGGVYRLRVARQNAADRITHPDNLNRALTYYQMALNEAIQARESQTEIKVRGAIASTLFYQGEGYLHQGDYARASELFDQTIQRASEPLAQIEQDQQARTMAEAYLTLGNATFEKGIAQAQNPPTAKTLYDQANAWYAKCIGLIKFDPTVVQGAVARCQSAQALVNEWKNKLP